MDAISAIASLFQLVEGALSVAKTSTQLYRTWQGADEDVRSADAQSKLLGNIVAEVHVLKPVLTAGEQSGKIICPFQQSQVFRAVHRSQMLLTTRNESGESCRSSFYPFLDVLWLLLQRHASRCNAYPRAEVLTPDLIIDEPIF